MLFLVIFVIFVNLNRQYFKQELGVMMQASLLLYTILFCTIIMNSINYVIAHFSINSDLTRQQYNHMLSEPSQELE